MCRKQNFRFLSPRLFSRSSCLICFSLAGHLVGFILVGKAFRILGLDERKGRWVVEQDFHGNFQVNVTWFFAFFSGVLDWIVLILVWFERSLHSAQVSRQSYPWQSKLMTSQAVERTWIHMGVYGGLRGEWVNNYHYVTRQYSWVVSASSVQHAEWSACRNLSPGVLGSSPSLATCWICSVLSGVQNLGHTCTSPAGCLLPVGVFNPIMFYLDYLSLIIEWSASKLAECNIRLSVLLPVNKLLTFFTRYQKLKWSTRYIILAYRMWNVRDDVHIPPLCFFCLVCSYL